MCGGGRVAGQAFGIANRGDGDINALPKRVARRQRRTDGNGGHVLHFRVNFCRQLYAKLAQLGPQALLTTLDQLAAGTLSAEPQNSVEANYAQKLSKEEARIDWQQSASQLERSIRAFNPWPVSYFSVAEQTIKVWEASAEAGSGAPGTVLSADAQGVRIQTGTGQLCLTELQRAGGKRLAAGEFLRGFALQPGQVLGAPAPAPCLQQESCRGRRSPGRSRHGS